jgi:hypothetical protein
VNKWIISKLNQVHKCHQIPKCIIVNSHSDASPFIKMKQQHIINVIDLNYKNKQFSQSLVVQLKPGEKLK